MKLSTLLDTEQLDQLIKDGYVNARLHPRWGYTIYNYSAKCTYEPGSWNDVTIQCRGLITDAYGNVIARPFGKFFNYGQEGCPIIDLNASCETTDKMDGSLGISYHTPTGYRIASRGSFDGEQAIHASEVWKRKYADYLPSYDCTLLFEIVYPANRIVLDYGGVDDLYLIGGRVVSTGESFGPNDPRVSDWPGPRAESLPFPTLKDALGAEPRKNAEGLVVFFPSTGDRVKLKQDDYVQLHKIVTGLNEKRVWEHMLDGELEELLALFPDEFHPWIKETASGLIESAQTIEGNTEIAFQSIVGSLGSNWGRKEFAMVAKDHPMKKYLFLRLDNQPFRKIAWRDIEPSGKLGPRGLMVEEV